MRLFVAILLPGHGKDVLSGSIAQMQKQCRSGSFTRQENLHLTLAFLGETEEVAAVRGVMDQCGRPPFPLVIQGVGHFGSIWWAGVENNPALSDLAGYLQDKLRRKGFPIERRIFQPHITLARQVKAAASFSPAVPRVEMWVERLSLMKSERIDGRTVYTEVYKTELQKWENKT